MVYHYLLRLRRGDRSLQFVEPVRLVEVKHHHKVGIRQERLRLRPVEVELHNAVGVLHPPEEVGEVVGYNYRHHLALLLEIFVEGE